jgi:hypothetical protein
MLTADDTTYEPKVSKKVFQLTALCFAMNAGHDGIQAEIMGMMQASINGAMEQKKDWFQFSVKGMADSYVEFHNQIKRKRISDSILAPFNLDQDAFISRQKELSDIFIRDISDQVTRFEMPETATIIAGIDNSTGSIEPHIYAIKRGRYESVVCCDASGYAVVGAGERHADTYLMQSNFTRHFRNTKTLFLCYAAKRRSEVAPGVGRQTDIRVMGPAGGFSFLGDAKSQLPGLADIYDKMIATEQTAEKEAVYETDEYMKGKLPIDKSGSDQK